MDYMKSSESLLKKEIDELRRYKHLMSHLELFEK